VLVLATAHAMNARAPPQQAEHRSPQSRQQPSRESTHGKRVAHDPISETAYGAAYEIEGPIETPSGRIVQFVSIWQIDTGSDVPRFITMYPR
jgi:hypothetical protein